MRTTFRSYDIWCFEDIILWMHFYVWFHNAICISTKHQITQKRNVIRKIWLHIRILHEISRLYKILKIFLKFYVKLPSRGSNTERPIDGTCPIEVNGKIRISKIDIFRSSGGSEKLCFTFYLQGSYFTQKKFGLNLRLTAWDILVVKLNFSHRNYFY